MPADRIVAVSTIKDTARNARLMVERNLAAGVDHLIVFLDADQPRVSAKLRANPHVTVVETASGYWHGGRPEQPSRRTRPNANMVNAVLSTVPSVRWLFSIDCDEVVSFDKDALLASELEAVRLPTLEAVATKGPPGSEPTHFKEKPNREQFEALVARGVIRRPTVRAYFRGHNQGKAGLRPNLDRRLNVHWMRTADGGFVDRNTIPGAFLLHYESWNFDAFVQKWRDYAPEQVHLRTHWDKQKRLGLAVHEAVHGPHLPDEERQRRLRQLYRRHVVDDFEALDALGLLVPLPPRPYAPRPLPPEDLAQIRILLTELRAADKSCFAADAPPGAPESVLRAVADRVVSQEPYVAARIEATLNA